MKRSAAFRRTTHSVATAAALTLVAIAPAIAQTTPPTMAGPRDDRAFVTTMLQASRGQLALAALARRRAIGLIATSAATETAQEWSLVRARLLPIAYADGAPVRGTLNAAQRAQLDRLGRTPAAQFDQAYLAAARRADTVALDRIEAEEQTTNQALLAFASYAQPLIESYQQMTADDEKDHPGA